MKQKLALFLILPVTVFIYLFSGCTTSKYTFEDVYTDGKYDTQFPSKEASQYINDIGKSVKLINCLTFYKQYQFRWYQNFTADSLKKRDILEDAKGNVTFSRSSSGTATIVGLDNDRVLFLTNAHVVYYQDTLVSYYVNESGKTTNIIESVSIKQSQTNYAAVSGIGNLELVVVDNKRDIAFAGGRIDNSFATNYKLFNFKLGESNQLEWGDFVYVLGFPMHYKMIASGIVSIVEDEEDFFLVDVNVNRGSSGGIVLALRDGIPNFEFVGIVSWVPAERRNVLTPKPLQNENRYQIDSKYEGDLLIGEVEYVKYGIAKVISMEAIKKTLFENEDLLRDAHYDLSLFKDWLD